MQKIYRFNTTNSSNHSITVNEFQPRNEEVILMIHTDEQSFSMTFSREEFHELCYMRYRIEYPHVDSPESQET